MDAISNFLFSMLKLSRCPHHSWIGMTWLNEFIALLIICQLYRYDITVRKPYKVLNVQHWNICISFTYFIWGQLYFQEYAFIIPLGCCIVYSAHTSPSFPMQQVANSILSCHRFRRFLLINETLVFFHISFENVYVMSFCFIFWDFFPIEIPFQGYEKECLVCMHLL